MMTRILLATATVLGLLAALPLVGQGQDTEAPARPSAEDQDLGSAAGVVFVDENGNGKRDGGEQGLAGVSVSNGLQVVVTDEAGAWELPIHANSNGDADTIFFVTKPTGYMVPVSADQLPQHYYIHKPAGSPDVRYGGVDPTGPLPDSIDFPLVPQEESGDFDVIMFADPQARDLREIDFVGRDVCANLIGTDAAFGITLGDILFDRLNLFEAHNGVVAQIGRPWFNVIGNHDINFDVPDDEFSDETFNRVYGPQYYSFDWGGVHFVALDDVEYIGGRRYVGNLGERQLAWLRNDLAQVPMDRMVVLLVHIPIASMSTSPATNVADRQALYDIIEDRPHLASFSGHMHFQHIQHIQHLTEEGWDGEAPFLHYQAATVSGCWWGGSSDERGIPHATMMDGMPNGYLRVRFDTTGETPIMQPRFHAASRPDSERMQIHSPNEVAVTALAPAADGEESTRPSVFANIYDGSDLSEVRIRFVPLDDSGSNAHADWQPMEQTYQRDPRYLVLQQTDGTPRPVPCPHLWKAPLPTGLPVGIYRIDIHHTDAFGSTSTGSRHIRVVEAE